MLDLERPVVLHLEPHFFPEHKSERVQIRYGPFTVPGSGVDNGMKEFNTRDAKPPCRDCMILWMQAGLEFQDGGYAGVKEGMWLHHTVLQNDGKDGLRSCERKKGKERQRFFASGNERTVVDLSANGWVTSLSRVCENGHLIRKQDAENRLLVRRRRYYLHGHRTYERVRRGANSCTDDHL
jgi:hypothetical protein